MNPNNPATDRGVGRPALGDKKRTKFSISMAPDVLARVRAAAGPRKLSEWLEAAAVAHLDTNESPGESPLERRWTSPT